MTALAECISAPEAREACASQLLGPRGALAVRIYHTRCAKGLTQAELSRRTGILRPNIARIESGKHEVTVDTVVRIAKALGVKPSAILGVLDEVSG